MLKTFCASPAWASRPEIVPAPNHVRIPVIHMPDADAAQAYQDVVVRLLGEERRMRFTEAVKTGFFKRIFDVEVSSHVDYFPLLQAKRKICGHCQRAPANHPARECVNGAAALNPTIARTAARIDGRGSVNMSDQPQDIGKPTRAPRQSEVLEVKVELLQSPATALANHPPAG